MLVSISCSGVGAGFPSTVFETFDMGELWTKECNGTKVGRAQAGKNDQTIRERTDMRWAPCALTQSSCPPGRTVSSRPIRSEQQGGACKVSRERAMGENVSITPWDAAFQPDLNRLCCLWQVLCMCTGGTVRVWQWEHVCTYSVYLNVCVCAVVAAAWQRQQSRPQHWQVWPLGYMREKCANYSHINHCTKKTNTQPNKQK